MVAHFWDDLAEGDHIDCKTITLTLPEIIEFAQKYDPQPFHIDEQAAASSLFGGIIASSLQTLSACTRVVADATGNMPILSGILIEQVRLSNPVRPDDILSIEACWADLNRSRSKPDRGMATARFKAVNQKGETVMESGFRYIIACRT